MLVKGREGKPVSRGLLVDLVVGVAVAAAADSARIITSARQRVALLADEPARSCSREAS